MSKPIRFTFFGVGSGSLGGASFHDTPFFVTVPADVERVYPPTAVYPSGTLQVDCAREAATISIFGRETAMAGLGLNVTRFRDSRRKLHWLAVGLAPDQLITISHPAFRNYDLDGPFPLVRGVAPFSTSGRAYPTTAEGDFVLNQVSSVAVQAKLVVARVAVAVA